MASKPMPPKSVLAFRPRGTEPDDVPELMLPLAPVPGLTVAASRAPALNLSGKPKVCFAIGRGRIGKTTLVRWAAETVASVGGQVICAAADPVNRSLRVYLEGVEEPPTNDPADVTQWLQDLLHFTMQKQASAIIDLGGGDTSLHRLLGIMPDLASVMEAEGVMPVAGRRSCHRLRPARPGAAGRDGGRRVQACGHHARAERDDGAARPVRRGDPAQRIPGGTQPRRRSGLDAAADARFGKGGRCPASALH